jgi:NADPH:quinone reductase-like Zn-dependent oxidoreductase
MPRPGRDEVLIRVKATAVNYADAIMVAGLWLLKTPNC